MNKTDTNALSALLDHRHPNWSRVRRLSLIRREVRESLSPEALRLLFHHADIMVEGSVEHGHPLGARVYATVMLTVELGALEGQLEESLDELTAHKISQLIAKDERVKDRLSEIACAHLQAKDLPAGAIQGCEIDMRARAEGLRVLIDGDAMVSLSSPREASS